MSPPERFRTARLHAERLTPDHADVVHALHRNARTMAGLGGVRDAAQTTAWLERNLAHWDAHGFGAWMLRESEDGPVIGRAVLRHLLLAGVDEIEVGYALHPDCWGRGLATEIAHACVRFGRTELEAPSLIGVTSPDNLASQRVLEKIGMRYERDVELDGVQLRSFRLHLERRNALATP